MAINIQGYYGINATSFWAGLFQNQGVNLLQETLAATALGRLFASQLASQRQTLLAQALTGLQNYGRQLQEAANPLTLSNVNNVFTERTVTFSAGDVLTAEALPNATITSYDLTVSQLAAAQQNLGTALTSSDPSAVNTGTNTFRLTVGETSYDLSVEILSTDTNRDALQKIADAINAANAVVTATVVNDTEAGTSRIQITADQTGTASAFSLTDVSGNAVTATGANTVSVAAADAEYTVNGVSYTAQSNTVLLDQGYVTVNFLKTTATEVTLTVGQDTAAIVGAVNNLVSAFNSLKSYTSLNASLLNPRIDQALTRAYNLKAPELASLGITTNLDGTLTVDQSELEAAVAENPDLVKSTFGSANGFAVNLGFLGQEITTSPLWSFAAPETGLAASLNNTYAYLLTLNQSQVIEMLFPKGTLVNFLA
ncbi:MAG: flagellar filament capping protein FliD [Bacillota bacterium]